MHLPRAFREKVRRVFGDKGRAWLAQLPQTLALCQDRWRLTNVHPSGELSYNLICFAESPAYGAVVLKIGVPHAELFIEMKALSLFAGRGVCACYDADVELGALLLERIVPGSDLTGIGNSEERYRIAASLMAALPVALRGDNGFPSYADWLSRAFTRLRAENKAGSELLSLVDIAERFFQEIDTPDRPRLLLHGDLHHKNILQDRHGGWKAIDPIFAEHLGERKPLLAKCALVDQVLSTCWSVEEEIGRRPSDWTRGVP